MNKFVRSWGTQASSSPTRVFLETFFFGTTFFFGRTANLSTPSSAPLIFKGSSFPVLLR